MQNYLSFRQAAIRYWERRRLWYNLILVPPTFLGYQSSALLSAAVGDHEAFGTLGFFALLLLCVLGANICYCFAYALEFLFGSDDPESPWLRYGRCLALVSGTLFAMLLALVGGRNIGIMQYWHR